MSSSVKRPETLLLVQLCFEKLAAVTGLPLIVAFVAHAGTRIYSGKEVPDLFVAQLILTVSSNG